MRKSVTIPAEYYQLAQDLDTEARGEFWDAVIRLAFVGKLVTDFKHAEAEVAFLAISKELRVSYVRFANGLKGKKYGKLGGAPKGNNNASKQPLKTTPKTTPKNNPLIITPKNNPKETTPKQPQNNPKTTPKTAASRERVLFEEEDNNIIINNLSKDKEKKYGKKENEKPWPDKHQHPNGEQAQAFIEYYCKQKGYAATFTGEYFVNKMQSIGWVVGKSRNPVKDWQATIRQWLIKDQNENNNGTYQPNNNDANGKAAAVRALQQCLDSEGHDQRLDF